MILKRIVLLLVLLSVGLSGRAHDSGNFVASDLFASMRSGDKAALLMVYFGTTHDDTRARTIDALNERVRKEFKDLEVREAWTSRIVIRRIKAQGVERIDPAWALDQLEKEGYTHVVVQPTNLIEGVEMEALRREVRAMQDRFKDLRLGNPLLYAPEDYEAVIDAIVRNGVKDGATVWVGHGTYTPTTAQYAMLDYMLEEKGFMNHFVGTIEGYPTFDTMERRLRASGERKVLLMPFMFVAGDHAKNDIAGEWKEELEKRGYQVHVFMEGLGQNPDIQRIFIEHIRFTIAHKPIDILDKKKEYAAKKD